MVALFRIPAHMCLYVSLLFGFLAFRPGVSLGQLYGSVEINDIITIDAGTGLGNFVGDYGNGGILDISGLAFDLNSNTLHGTDINALNGNEYHLVTINRSTGQATLVNLLTDSGTPVAAMAGLAFDVNSDTLYGTSFLDSHDNLFTINPATGAASQVGLDNRQA